LLKLQEGVKKRFPGVDILRSIPIPVGDSQEDFSFDRVKAMFEPLSDCFLTDTMMTGNGSHEDRQPVNGFVGITGKTCNWDLAADLVKESGIPVILAGGISPGNVYDCIKQTHPYGVDSCTLTNALDSHGRPVRFKKDPDKVNRFIEEVRRAEKDLYGG
jgi:phosphoribosylanthranilate isomerase